MGLFDTFRETIFLKEDSDLERQINDLKQLPNYSKNKNILKDIKLLEIGLQGEKEIEFELKNANIGMYVLHDVTIKQGDLTAQIDYVIITKGFTYLVECKNLIGNITVDNKGEFRREYEIGKNKYKEAIYSPYTQAVRHKDVLKKRWLEKNNKLMIALRESSFDKLWYKPLVVLANSKSLLNTRYAPKEIKSNTIRVDQLVRYMEEDLRKYDSDLFSSKKNMLELANSFLAANIVEYKSISDKYKKNNDVEMKLEEEQTDMKEKPKVEEKVEQNEELNLEQINQDLVTILKKFRKEKSESMHVPAYYVFTNKELEQLIELKPKTLEDLRNSKILTEIKVQCHGQEIIDIFNSK